MNRIVVVGLAGMVMLAAAGCSIVTSYPGEMAKVQAAFANGDFARARADLGKMDPARRDLFLHLCERGTVAHTMGDYDASAKELLRAVEVAKEFDDRAVVSLRDSGAYAGAMLINDKTIPYRGSGFERVLLHTYLAINFLMRHDLQGARVEILRGYAKQRELREQHEKSIERSREAAQKQKVNATDVLGRVQNQFKDQQALLQQAGNIYQNAFTYYVSSLVYELGGEFNAAYIDLKNIYAANPAFRPAWTGLLRCARRIGFRDDYEKWRQTFGSDVVEDPPPGHGEIVVLYQCGQSPVKEEIKITIPIPTANRLHLIPVAFPKYKSRYNAVTAARLVLAGKELGTTQPLMDVEATAVRDLWDQAPGIAFRQAARAAGRVAASEIAQREFGLMGLLGAVIVSQALEQADLRSWLTLPKSFQALRVAAPAGTHDLRFDLVGGTGRISLAGVPVQEGRVTVINLRSIGNIGTGKYVQF